MLVKHFDRNFAVIVLSQNFLGILVSIEGVHQDFESFSEKFNRRVAVGKISPFKIQKWLEFAAHCLKRRVSRKLFLRKCDFCEL